MFKWIFAGVPGGIKRQWSCQRRQFFVLSLTISSKTLEIRPTLYIAICSSSSAFQRPKCVTLNDLEWPFYTFNSFHAGTSRIFLRGFENNWRQKYSTRTLVSDNMRFMRIWICKGSVETKSQTTVGWWGNHHAGHCHAFWLSGEFCCMSL